jgi:tetratricopeptide (TPR) repeat protein
MGYHLKAFLSDSEDDDEVERLYNLALSDCNEAIRLKPDYAEAFGLRGSIYDDMDNYSLAIQDYSEAIRLNPQDYVQFNNRGSVYQNLKKYDEAIKDYNTAIQLAPADRKGGLIFRRGKVYKGKGEEKKPSPITTKPAG